MKNSTQLTVLSVLALALTGVSAFADFRPGRVRAGVVSEMRTAEATGSFERVSGARVELNFEDGKSAPVSITLKVDGASSVLPIVKIAASSCGDQYVAITSIPSGFRTTRLELTDYSNIQCRLFVANKWHVTVQHSDEINQKSELKLEGQPEYLAVTLTTRVR